MTWPFPLARWTASVVFAFWIFCAPSNGGAQEPKFNPTKVLIKKLRQAAPARIHIQRRYDKGVRYANDTTVVELFKDGSSSALAFSAQQPDQQTLYFYTSDRMVRYSAGVLGPDGRVKPASPGKLTLTAFVTGIRGFWDHPAADAFQLQGLRLVPLESLELTTDGTISYTNIEEGVTILGSFSREKDLFTSLRVQSADGAVVTYVYDRFTNFHGVFLPESMRLKGSRGGQASESHYTFAFEDIHDLVSSQVNLDPPLQTLVTDERFEPHLTYYAEKEHYPMEDLVLMHKMQTERRGAMVETPGRGSGLRWFQYVSITCAVVLPFVMGICWVRARRNRGR